ncbi:hypothetical protein [Nocardioides sp. zg-1228]|uniref:hypothetical protein n=1 Tax=Nocardioides sp. zg-1228 TaxID=2763008 RepID=UPI00164245BD|nr:hypothetical protein [Nocardioides sp. zg-1228]MBC2933043.1 hypothetical protein [Nocardioides sp. zg-1228]QSF56763.1 hypothetical protein JX575_14300 [Nocardioides sp. zg-1228]
MRSQQLEARVLHLVEQVLAGSRVEDDRVECKGVWPTDHRKAARQIAGLANAAAGEAILWIVGLDEDSSRLVESGSVEPSSWWGQVFKVFAGVAPEPRWLHVPVAEHGSVTAVLFDTSRAPYVVTTDGRGGVHREIPWRTSGSTRSAHRSEILRAVVGEAQVPQIEPISGHCRITHEALKHDGSMKAELSINLKVEAYVEASQSVTLPEHRWDLRVRVGGHKLPLEGEIQGPREYLGRGEGFLERISGGRYGPIGSIVAIPGSGLTVAGSERITMQLHSRFMCDDPDLLATIQRAQRLHVEADFPIALSGRGARFSQSLRRASRSAMDGGRPLDVDIRIGEFTHDGTEHPETYYGTYRSNVAGYQKPEPGEDPRALLDK